MELTAKALHDKKSMGKRLILLFSFPFENKSVMLYT
jgi:hypothetical protein